MKIVFLGNYFNHHQKPVSDELDKRVDYSFIATEAVPEVRKKLGYINFFPPYVKRYYLDEEERKIADKRISEADVIIAGSAPEKMVRKSIKTGKVMFRYSERPLKDGLELLKYPIRFVRWHWRNPGNKPIYMLCASAYTAGDYAKFGLFKGHTYKWGYFPETVKYDEEELFANKKKNLILWCARFLPLKHPEHVIEVADRLKKDGHDLELQFIGIGPLEDEMKTLVKEKGLQDNVIFLGSMKPEEVRERMNKAGIFLFTSDRQEGWGAVLNEAMNSGCAVVASHEIGAVPFLLRDKENGYIYKSGNVDMLYEKVKYLLENIDEQERLGKAAYQTIVTEWNAEEAGRRFLNLAKHILNGEKNPQLYDSGPCSKAEIIRERLK